MLSAYLDGELTAEDRAAVEARLERDPAARKTLDELRQLSSTVQSLPAEGLGYDLKQRVLDQIGLEQISQKQIERATPANLPMDHHSSGRRRGFVWAGLATAATLMLMFFASPDREVREPVAAVDQVKEATPAAEPAQATPSSQLSMQADSESDDKLAAATASQPAPVRSQTVSPKMARSGTITDGKAVAGDEAFGTEVFSARQNAQAQGMLSESTPARPGRVQGQPETAELGAAGELADVSDLAELELAAMPREESAVDEPLESEPVDIDSSTEGRLSKDGFSPDQAVDAVELAYNGEPQEALARLETMFTRQGVLLRVASREQLLRLQEGGSPRDLSRLDNSNTRQSEGQSSRALSEPLAVKNLPLAAKKELEESDKKDVPTEAEGLLVEATPEEIARVVKSWRVSHRGVRSSRAQGAGDYGEGEYGGGRSYGGGESGGYGGGGGGGMIGRVQSQETDVDERDASWAMRLKMSPEQWRRTGEDRKSQSTDTRIAELAQAEQEGLEEKSSISGLKPAPKRVRVFFYFREHE
ncbi:anti-sigma factor [Adhaeretor mobilis]|uniref:Putative zinc-finger domain-containing protein n=1 Tax=Adhaeretor mobilis TaxID=1930276 RepID=A0A517N2J9_9BACT|nr:zf-HC2 domain-containing protein [Adhaeretor mobilis]QDT01366.1 hypothetical protein HG15A2_47080 [Adhaeretor mobilis]